MAVYVHGYYRVRFGSIEYVKPHWRSYPVR